MKKLLWLFLVTSLLLCSPCLAGVDFNGDADYIKSGSNTGITGSQNRTISMWFKTSNTSNDTCWLSFGVNTTYDLYSVFRDNVADNDKIRVAINGGNNVWNWAAHDDGEWHILIIILDGTSTSDITAYGDGVALAVSSTNDKTITTSDSLLYIGYDIPSSKGPWDGEITEVAIWNTNITVSEVALLSSSRVKRIPLQVQPSNLVVYYPLDDYPESAGTIKDYTFKDLSSNGNDGTGVDANDNSDIAAETVLSYQ